MLDAPSSERVWNQATVRNLCLMSIVALDWLMVFVTIRVEYWVDQLQSTDSTVSICTMWCSHGVIRVDISIDSSLMVIWFPEKLIPCKIKTLSSFNGSSWVCKIALNFFVRTA